MQLALGRVPLEYPVNHKLRVLVRVDVDPGHVTLEVTGCLTHPDFPALLHIIQRAGRLGAGTDVFIDLHGASHLDPEILLLLRSIAAASRADAPSPGADESGTGERVGTFRVTLAEPAELPICLLHVGADGAVLAGLEGRLPVVPLFEVPAGSAAAGSLPAGDVPAGAGPAVAVSGAPAVPGPTGNGRKQPGPTVDSPSPDGCGTIGGLELSEYFEGTLDPAATVRALSDVALGQLADALYRHLDTANPSFGAHTWYELAAEELQNRKLRGAGGAGMDKFGAGQAIA